LVLELVKEAHIILCGTLGKAFTAVVYYENFAVLVDKVSMVEGSVVVDQVRVTVLLSVEPSSGQIKRAATVEENKRADYGFKLFKFLDFSVEVRHAEDRNDHKL